MSLYRRGSIWWAKWRISGKRIAESTGTSDEKKAREWHDRRRAALWDEIRLGRKPTKTWDQAALDWWTTHGQDKRSAEDDRLRLAKLTAGLTGKQLETITVDVVQRAVPTRMRDRKLANGKIKPGRPLSTATKNRYIALASVILHHAATKGWLARAPVFTYAEEGDGRFDFLSVDEAAELLTILPEHLAAMAKLALATGLRRRNVTHLEWSQVDLARRCAWIWGDEAKGGAPIAVPLNADAMAALEAQQGKHFRWCFVYRGRPVTRTKTKAWDKAVAKIGRPGFAWHGLRHTWASWHAMNETPADALQKLGGWRSHAMVQRYAHLAPGHLAQYADRVAMGTKSDTDSANVSERYQENQQGMGWTTGLEPATTGITILGRRKKRA